MQNLYTHVMTPQREATLSNQVIDSQFTTSYASLFNEPASELADRIYLLTRFSAVNPSNPRDKTLLRAQAKLIGDLHAKLQDSIDSLSVAVL